MKYSLGLDIGITSVGWAVLNLDEHRIERLGVRAFNAAEDPQTRAPLAEPRRLARGARRRLRRRAGRIRRAKDLFVSHGLIEAGQRESAFEARAAKPSPWQLRADGLDRLLTGEEFARALFHIIKRRGFKSNRREVGDAEDGKMLAGITRNRQVMEERGYRTAGEMLWRDAKFGDRKRNTADSYENTVDRELLEDEIKVLFARQGDLGRSLAHSELEAALVEVFRWQKPFASGDDVLKLIGDCTFEPGEKRAARHSYHAERFNLLGKINSLTYTVDGEKLFLTQEQRRKIEDRAYDKAKVTYAQIRAALNLPHGARFTPLNYIRARTKDADPAESVEHCERQTFFELTGYHALRRALSSEGLWAQVRSSPDLMDDLTYALTFFKTDEDISQHLGERGVSEEVVTAALNCEGFTKTLHLSTMAIKKILPYLEQGFVYSEACAKAGYDHSHPTSAQKLGKLPPIPPDVTRNPVVLRALSQARKVVNAVIGRYGSPYRIHIELARDMGKSAEERREIEARQRENRRERERLEEQFREEFERQPTSTDLLKWRLYREQGGKCAYSLQTIDIQRLFEPGYAEIDHILPYSRSFDDGRSNKVLALAAENQRKKDQTPYETFGHDQDCWDQYEAWVRAVIRDPKKRNNLLRKSFDERQEAEWKERNLSDTRYISREFSRFVRDNLQFAEGEDKLRVVCVNGQITARARWLWGLEEKASKKERREEDDLHHALDAAVVGALLPHQVKLITQHAKVGETRETYVDRETGEIIEWDRDKRPRLPHPWKGFRDELQAKLGDVMVSRMPLRKLSGAIHEETIRSVRQPKADEKPFSVVRKPLTSLSEKDLANLYAPETNEKLYSAIRQRMAEFAHVPDKNAARARAAFAEPLRKPTKHGSPGPVVRGIKVCQTQLSGEKVRGGIADNGDMVRTDVFRKENKYYLVPVYVSDKMKGMLPDRAIASGKPQEEWPVVDESYEFLFSLCPYDLVRVGEFLGYFRGTNRNTGSIVVCEPNNLQKARNLGARNAGVIEKCETGVLGDYHPVRREVRRGLENGGNLESGEAED